MRNTSKIKCHSKFQMRAKKNERNQEAENETETDKGDKREEDVDREKREQTRV